MSNITAQLIATLLMQNCEAYFDGAKSRAEWDAEQVRLWAQAAEHNCTKAVARLVIRSVA